jgi:hypothetical protein
VHRSVVAKKHFRLHMCDKSGGNKHWPKSNDWSQRKHEHSDVEDHDYSL